MRVADGVHIVSRLVYLRVDEEARRVDGPSLKQGGVRQSITLSYPERRRDKKMSSPSLLLVRISPYDHTRRTLLPPTILPEDISRHSMSLAFIRAKCFPRGFIQMQPGNSGSRTLMWPEMPSVKPTRAQLRKTAAMCSTMCSRWVWKDTKLGMPGVPHSESRQLNNKQEATEICDDNAALVPVGAFGPKLMLESWFSCSST